MIKRIIPIFLVLVFSALSFPRDIQAKSGCCSGHDGVNCSAGAQGNGNVICNDGSTGSSCKYSEMVMCGGSSAPSAPIVVSQPVTATSTFQPTTPSVAPKVVVKKVVALTEEQKCEVKKKPITNRVHTQEQLKEKTLTQLNTLVTKLETRKDKQASAGYDTTPLEEKILVMTESITAYQHAYDAYTNAMYTTLNAACSSDSEELLSLRKQELTLSKQLVPLKKAVLTKNTEALKLKLVLQ